MKVINLFGGPCAGKSMVAGGLFHEMKKRRFRVEYATEYAKDLVWSERKNMFTEQDYIFAKQNHKLRRLAGKNKVDYVITDCPLLMMIAYIPDDYPTSLEPFIVDMFNTYDNINYFIHRTHPYDPEGRNQTEEQADEMADKILDILKFYTPGHMELDSDKALEFILHQSLSWKK